VSYLDERDEEFRLFFNQTCVPGVLVRIGLDNLIVQPGLDFLTVGRGEITEGQVDVAGQGVKTSSHNGQTDRLELVWDVESASCF
jgi:hypothetical protein